MTEPGGSVNTAAAGDSNSWEEAQDASSSMILQSVLEDLENRAAKQQDELLHARQKIAEMDSALKASQNECTELREAFHGKSEDYNKLQLEFQELTTKSLSLEESSKMNQERVNRLEIEQDRLREEISRLNEENDDYKAKIVQSEMHSKLDESSVLPLQYQVQRLNKEIDTIQSHSNWLEAVLQSKTDELSNLKISQASETAKLRGDMDRVIAEKESMEAELKSLRGTVEDLQQKNAKLSREVYEARQDAIDTKASTDQELVSSRRVCDLQKQQLERLQQRYDGMAKQLQALKTMAEHAEKESEDQWKEQERQLQAASKRILAEQASEYKQKIASMQEKLDEANRRCKQAEDGLLQVEIPATSSGRLALPFSSTARALGGKEGTTDEEPLNLTDLYGRLAQTEDALSTEMLRRKQAEIRVEQLVAEIEASAPILNRQRQEYELAMERQDEYKRRIEDALNDAASARNETSMLQAEMMRLRKKNEELVDDTKELSKQVQELLISRSGGAENPTVPQTVAQMQGANARLLKEYRELKRSFTELEEKLQSDEKSQEIEYFKKELESLRQDRKRQETLVNGIVQQRDLYRALLMKTDASILGNEDENSALEIVKRQSARSKALESEHKKVCTELSQTQAQLDSLSRDTEAAALRLLHYEALNGELTSTVDRLTLELSSSKSSAARGEVDAMYQKEKVARLEESLQRNQQELKQVTSAKDQLMKLNASLEQAISKANVECSRLDTDLKRAKSKLLLVEAQAESAKAAEKRISDEALQLRSDLSRQGAMIESIQRIESSLMLKSNSEIVSYKAEIQALRQKLSGMEQASFTGADEMKRKIEDQEIRIRELEDSQTKATNQALEAKNESLEALKKLEEASKKVYILEAQLKTAKKRLGVTNEDQESKPEMQSKLASVTADLEATKRQIESWKERATTYEKIAKENEAAVVQMTQSLKDAKKETDEEISRLREEIDQANLELTKRKEVIVELTNDLALHRSQKEKAVNEVRQQVASLTVEVEKYTTAAQDAEKRYQETLADMNVLRSKTSEAQSNYERELALHAAARTDLRTAKEDCDKEMRLRQAAEEEVSRLTNELDMQQSALNIEKSKLEDELKVIRTNLEDSRAQNKLLHAQLEKITEQIDNMQTGSRENRDEATAEDVIGNDEISDLRRNVSELREIVKFVRSEKDAIQAELDSARRGTERERLKASVAQRTLEDFRAEMKRVEAVSQEKLENAKALSDRVASFEEQRRLLNDSNSHLQQQVVELNKKLAVTLDELKASKTTLAPLENTLKDLETEKAALFAENESLKKEIDDWKQRVQSLVSRFNQVDPEDHKKLSKKNEDLDKQVKQLQKKKEDAEEETRRIRTLASRASSQLTQNKQLVENQKKIISKLTSENEALAKTQKNAASPQDVVELREKLLKMEKDRENEKIQLNGANEMNEKLRNRLREFQKTILTLQKKETALNNQLSEVRTRISNQKELDQAKSEVADEKADALVPAAASAVELPKAQPEKTTSTVEKMTSDRNEKVSSSFAASHAEEKSERIERKVDKSTLTHKVPPGGFNFGPSESNASSAQQSVKATDLKNIPVAKKRPGEPLEEKKLMKKPSVQTPIQATVSNLTTGVNSGEQTYSSSDASAAAAESAGRTSGERNELSMKEKLLEKKRKLMEAMKKAKEERLKQALEDIQEPETKKAKIGPGNSSSEIQDESANSSLDQEKKTLVQTTLPSTGDDGSGGAKPDERKESEITNTEAKSDPEFSNKSGSILEEQVNPFAKTPTTTSIFGEGIGVTQSFGALGTGPTTTFASGFGKGPSFGQTSGFGAIPGPSLGTTETTGTKYVVEEAKTSEGSLVSQSSDFDIGSAFLNMKPPGSSAAPPRFSFGTSNNIQLPTPATVSPQSRMVNAFSTPIPFGGSGVATGTQGSGNTSTKPLFSKQEDKVGNKDESEAEDGEMEDSTEA